MPRSQVDGRPTKLTQALRKLDDGAVVTIGDEIIERMRGGASTHDVSDAVGLARSTLMDWLREGARHAARRLSGEKLTKRERTLADFSDREAAAVAEWKERAENTLQGLSLHRPRTTVTEKYERASFKDADTGEILRDTEAVMVERTVKEETVEPDPKVIQWRLERRFPDQYGRQRLEITGADGAPVSLDVKLEARAVLESMVERLAANAKPEASAETSDDV